MRGNKRLMLAGLIALPLFSWAAIAHAQSFRSGDTTTVLVGETVNSSLFVTGKTIDIAGNVQGDVFCAGQNVTITGYVSGDVICAGQSVHVTGKVDGDVRIAGQNVTVGGMVAHNLTAAGQTVVTEGNSRVEGDAVITGQDMTLNGYVGRDVSADADTVTINGRVGRNLQSGVRQLTLGNGARVNGDASYMSNQNVLRAKDAWIAGSLTRKEPKPADRHEARNFLSVVAIWWFVSMLLFALVLVLVMPQTFHTATSGTVKRMGKTFLVGLIASIIVPVVILVLFATVVGIPLALLALLVWVVVLMLCGPFAAYLTGRLLLRKRTTNAIWIMLLGAFVLLVLFYIPFLGGIILLLSVWLGIGTILLNTMSLPKPNYVIQEDHVRKVLRNEKE